MAGETPALPGFAEASAIPVHIGKLDLLTTQEGRQRTDAMKPDMSHFDRPAPISPTRLLHLPGSAERAALCAALARCGAEVSEIG